ncbi:hypothetical protein [Vibrio diazotrophicus]|uniref:hypothetical protein n=1 Tax=Vibrio diazotrophicus TaxID=685 RepID=UPI00142E2649|nr:hypothetical protein [Vibrio diazotrophicus]NIY91099.1 hypothetical protein [Vibrio diazotrophicus]
MASSEFILAPRIDERKMREESKKMELSLQRSARQAAEDFEYWFGKGFERGAERGATKVKTKLKNLQGFLMITGANLASNAVMAAASAAKEIATKVFDGAEEYAQIARERLNDMADLNDNADALGINRGRYAALSAVGISARLDQSDIRGILSGFVGALERPEMALYKDSAEKNGIENSFLDFVGTMAKMKPETAAQYMNQVFGDEDALLASRFMKPFKQIIANEGVLSFQNIMDTMFGGKVRTNDLDTALNQGANSAAILARGDGDAFQKKIIDGISQVQAKSVVEADASEASRIQAHLEVLDLKVKGKLLADKAEIKTVQVEQQVMKGAVSYFHGAGDKWKALKAAGSQPINSLENWQNFMGKLWVWGVHNPVTATTGRNGIQLLSDYTDRHGREMNSALVQYVEEHAENNKNRADVGPNAMK